MTAAPATAPAGQAPSAPPAHRTGFGGLLISEWTKIRSVRSTVWTLLLFVIITIGLTVLIASLTAANWDNGPRHLARDATIIADPVGLILRAGIGLGQLTICVLGVLVISTEYSTGVIRASLLAVPRRLPMLWAKLTVFALIIVVLAEVVAFAAVFTGAAILHSHVQVSLSQPNVTRAVVGAGLYLTVLGLFAIGIGGLIRHTAGAISTVIGIVLIVPIITSLLPDNTIDNHINAYLPTTAGTLVAQAQPGSGDLLTAWQGFGVECIWAVLALAAAAWLLRRRDA